MELKTLVDEVLNVFQALSLIIVFLSIYFGIKFPEIQLKLREEEKKIKADKLLQSIEWKKSLFYDFIPLMIPQIILSYLFFPLTIKVLKNTSFNFTNFNTVLTSYITIIIIICLSTIWSIYSVVRIIYKILKLKKN